MQTTQTTTLPAPNKGHATCAWCGHSFATIVDLIDHVDRGHLADWDAALSAS
jgi:hypothetical protein